MQQRKSMGSSTLSSRGPISAEGSAILTDDESGSNPPPTISDGMSTKDNDLTGFSGPSQGKVRAPAAAAGPPPPPYRRSNAHHDYDGASHYSGGAPVRSILTNKGSGDADTIVSDPTLDAGLADPLTPPASAISRKNKDSQYKSSSSTNSYNHKESDETDLRSSSEINPSSHEGDDGNRVVDNIVAAALAYAEKTHSESVRGSGTTSSSQRKKPPRSLGSTPGRGGATSLRPPQKQKQKSAKAIKTPTVGSDSSSSIHSFYTDESSDKGSQKRSHSTGNPRFTKAAPVDDLVAKALSHAQGQLDTKKPQPPVTQQHRPGVGTGKSVTSMYSEETDFSYHEVHFDC